MLHIESKQISKSANVAQVTEMNTAVISTNALTVQSDTSVLLATALIGVFAKNGNRVVLRALLDQGSQSAFISENAAQTLGLLREIFFASIAGIGATNQNAKWSINLTILPRFESTFILETSAIVLPKLTRSAKNDFNLSQFDMLHNLTLADPSCLQASEIDIILGAAEYAQILRNGLIKVTNSMIAQNTEFGWVISGTTQNVASSTINVVTLISNVILEQRLTKIFDSDNFEQENIEETEEEQKQYAFSGIRRFTEMCNCNTIAIGTPFLSQSKIERRIHKAHQRRNCTRSYRRGEI